MLKKEWTSVTAGTPTTEGTLTTFFTPGAERMLITAGPQQQQKSQLQHKCENVVNICLI